MLEEENKMQNATNGLITSLSKLSKHYSYLKTGVYGVVTPCGSCKNRRFGGTWRLLHQGDKNR
jgi:hypothetical protein